MWKCHVNRRLCCPKIQQEKAHQWPWSLSVVHPIAQEPEDERRATVILLWPLVLTAIVHSHGAEISSFPMITHGSLVCCPPGTSDWIATEAVYWLWKLWKLKRFRRPKIMTNISVIDDKEHDKFLEMYLTDRHSLRSALKHDLHLKS